MEEELKRAVLKINVRQKEMNVLLLIVAFFFGILMLVLYLVVFREMQLFSNSWISVMFRHIGTQISTSSLLGVFYTGLFGGLFFIPIPMEVMFIRAINRTSHDFMIMAVLLLGIFVSYSFNYLIGLKLSYLARKLISVKKFYQLKTFINRYGKYGVFLFNVLPLPSQQLTFVLGVFRYNKTRLIVFTLMGQVVKYSAIILGFQQILQKVL